MRLAITGADGRIGRACVEAAVAAGHDVLALDRQHAAVPARGVKVREVDLAGSGLDTGLLADVDAVIHLAGIAAPTPFQPSLSFGVNVMAAFNVFQAAAAAGVDRVVAASSASALGMAWAASPEPPLYFPIDEHHALRPADHYALSKQVTENIAESTTREAGLSSVVLRFPWVADDETLPAKVEAVRRDPGEHVSVRDVWSYVHLSDIADAFVHVAEAGVDGFSVFNVVAPDTLSDVPTEDLLRTFYPQVPIQRPIAGTESAWSASRLREATGFQATRSWRTTHRDDKPLLEQGSTAR